MRCGSCNWPLTAVVWDGEVAVVWICGCAAGEGWKRHAVMWTVGGEEWRLK